MRVAVVHTGKGESEALGGIAGAVAREFVAQGHIVDTANRSDHKRLSLYDFIVICSEPESLGGTLGPGAAGVLADAGDLVGKRSMALLRKSGFRPAKALASLMKAMEAEGMIVTCAEIVSDAAQAAAAAREAPLKRN